MQEIQTEHAKARLDLRPDAEAEQMTEKHQMIWFTNRDFDAFVEALDADAEPNPALKRAAERYRQRFCE